MLERIPVQTLLQDRGIAISSNLCVLCNKEPESVNHLLVYCSYATEVQSWIFKWCGFSLQNPSTVHDVIDYAFSWGTDPKHKAIGNTVLFCYFWCVWLARNDKVFKNIWASPAKVADNIMAMSFSWCKNRSSFGCGSWNFDLPNFFT